jgi:hypothetical protein
MILRPDSNPNLRPYHTLRPSQNAHIHTLRYTITT